MRRWQSVLGPDIVDREKIAVHDCDRGRFTYVGTSPNGNRIELNSLACEADLIIAEGFIEPHFFAGYSGGRKSILPGIASRRSIMYNQYCGSAFRHGQPYPESNPSGHDVCSQGIEIRFYSQCHSEH